MFATPMFESTAAADETHSETTCNDVARSKFSNCSTVTAHSHVFVYSVKRLAMPLHSMCLMLAGHLLYLMLPGPSLYVI